MFAQHDLLDVLRRAAERQHEILLVGLAQDLLDGALFELDDVLEDEQHAAHLLGEVLVGRGELLEHVALGGAVGVVEDLGQRLGAPGSGVLALGHRVQLVADDVLDLLDDLRTGLPHAGDPQRDVRLLTLGQTGEHLGRERRVAGWRA